MQLDDVNWQPHFSWTRQVTLSGRYARGYMERAQWGAYTVYRETDALVRPRDISERAILIFGVVAAIACVGAVFLV